MKDETCYLFVYGTLRKGAGSPVVQSMASATEWIGFSRVRGILYDLGAYPGARPDLSGSSVIEGEIIRLKSPVETLQLLDEYEGYDEMNEEGSEYIRKKEVFTMDNGNKLEAWMYWYHYPPGAGQRIHHGDYLKYLQKKQLA